jgi:hypothetical protein
MNVHPSSLISILFTLKVLTSFTFTLYILLTTQFVDIQFTISRGPKVAGFDFELIKQWTNNCKSLHGACNDHARKSVNWYPTRLLDVGSSDQDVRLIVTKLFRPSGPYMTLSHRWGNQKYQRLETNTELAFQNSIDVSCHPLVFRQAMALTRAMGVRYLWIDALCIKQDSDLIDWKVESLTMHLVYSNSHLNISATQARDGTESLISREGWDAMLPPLIVLEIDNVQETFYVFDDDIWNDEIENAALNTRGWVFQERYLAPRILHFGSTQMAWECRQHRTLEMFMSSAPPMLRLSGLNTMQDIAASSELVQFRHFWCDLAERYSRCDFTKHTDKLVALAGVATRIEGQRPTRDVYVAGMWRSTLLYDLAWSRSYQDVEKYPTMATAFRAPTWSWASVDGEVAFPIIFPHEQCQPLVQIESFQGEKLDHKDGILFRGQIEVTGFCLPLILERTDDGSEICGFSSMGTRFNIYENAPNSSIQFEITTQEASDLERRGRLAILPLVATTSSLYGIIISKTYGISTHRRVGAVDIALTRNTHGYFAKTFDLAIPIDEGSSRREAAESIDAPWLGTDMGDPLAAQFLERILRSSLELRKIKLV